MPTGYYTMDNGELVFGSLPSDEEVKRQHGEPVLELVDLKGQPDIEAMYGETIAGQVQSIARGGKIVRTIRALREIWGGHDA